MATTDLVLFENTDMVLKVVNLRETVAETLVTGATVTANVFDDADVLVVGAGSPISFTEQVGFEGLYHGPLPDTASLVDGDTGTVQFIADAGAGLHREWTETYVVRAGSC